NQGTVKNCYNTGSVNGSRYVGGVVGYSISTINACYNEGDIIGSNEVGGVAGSNQGTVKNCYNTGSVSGNSRVGGVAGWSRSVVHDCYNTGPVSGSDEVGGVVGTNIGTVTNCYYLNGCATDGDDVTQFGIGNETAGSTTSDVTGQTDSKTADWFASGEVCTAVGYHCGSGAANGFCDLCIYDAATLNADNYYEISNGGQLFWFGNYINTIDRTANAVLTADIDLEGRALSPIGKAANKYAGVFDGQGHTISNFNITITGVGNWGLFGYVAGEGTVIKNFSINGDVTTSLTSNVDVQYGVVGQADGGAEIRNVHSSVNLTSKDAYQKKYFGGIVGRTGNITVDMCSFNGTLSLGSNTLDCVGGIVGYVYNGKTAGITNCGFYGSIVSTYSSGSVGGILGYYNGENAKALTVSNCLSVGTLPEGRNAIVGAIKNYGSTNAGSNNYYLDGVTNSVTNVTAAVATQTQLVSGEIAIALGDAWGQMSNTEGSLPIITDNELYKVVTVGETCNYSVANVGDTNGDGTVDVIDYQALVNKALADDHEQIETANYDDIVRYDLDGDGYLDVIDAYLLHLFINGFATVDVYAVGDYDLNGVAFEEADLKAIKHAIENPETLATYKKYASDINGDGKLDENDLTVLDAKYGEVTGTECADNVEVYYRWGNKYSTCTATAMCTLCGKKVATETVNSVQNADGSYTATFTNTLLGTKTYKK
ncbi:MAG: dockerin type I repeat-containing protein, partial [Acutalibacteraceae bacterium]|nr:dockerin type I repeat-containing protein [Acutalibacteraceae bacterium]